MSARGNWVLAVRLRQFGDVLAALDSVRALREHDASRRVAYVVDRPYEQVLDGVRFIDRVMAPPRGGGMAAWLRFLAEVRSLKVSAAVDFHGSARSALIVLASGAPVRVGYDLRGRRLAYTVREPRGEFEDGAHRPRTPLAACARLVRHVGASVAGDLPPALHVPDAARQSARARLLAAGVDADTLQAGRVVGLNPGRPVASKAWPVPRFAALARSIVRDGGQAVVMWGPGEEAVAHSVVAQVGTGAVLSPRFSLGELPGALVNLAALVTIDSGLKHLAVCTRVPTVTVFGSTDPREWHMGGARDAFLWRGLSCSPCRRAACPFGTPCMDIPEGDVHAALRRIWLVAT